MLNSMTQQLNLFAFAEQKEGSEKEKVSHYIPTNKSLDTSADVKEIRTSAQKNKKVSYDVGERIGGAKKHLAQLRKQFEESHDINTLRELESKDKSSAIELITKDEIFKSFSLENEKDSGTEPFVAKFKQLMIRRIDKQPGDSATQREDYLTGAKNLLEIMNSVKTGDDLQSMIRTLNKLIVAEWNGKHTPDYHEKLKKRIEVIQKLISKTDKHDPVYKTYLRRLESRRESLLIFEEAKEKKFLALGESFVNLFTRQSSLNSTLRNSNVTWDELLKTKKAASNTKKKRKSVWDRQLPDRPDRVGGQVVEIETPKQMVSLFGCKGVQFGHYVDDEKASEHIIRASEALVDLAELLGVTNEFTSLEGTLGLAFGARGSGSALGHYEPLHKVINFTKKRGTLGILAHEWFHALDNFVGTKGSEKVTTYLSDEDSMSYDWIPFEIRECMHDLLSVIKEGLTKTTLKNENFGDREWTIPRWFKELYDKYRQGNTFDAEGFSKEFFERNEKNKAESLKLHSDKTSARYKRSVNFYDEAYKDGLQAVMWIHEKRTGERLKEMPYFSYRTILYQKSIMLDRDNVGKYFSSNRELLARCFEAYIQDNIESLGRRNDYLVAGTRDAAAYPIGEHRKKINRKMEELINLIVENYRM